MKKLALRKLSPAELEQVQIGTIYIRRTQTVHNGVYHSDVFMYNSDTGYWYHVVDGLMVGSNDSSVIMEA